MTKYLKGRTADVYVGVPPWRNDVRLDVSDGNSTVVVYLSAKEAKTLRKYLRHEIKKTGRNTDEY